MGLYQCCDEFLGSRQVFYTYTPHVYNIKKPTHRYNLAHVGSYWYWLIITFLVILLVVIYLLRGENKDMHWESLFDIIIVGACKPAFLTDMHLSLFRIYPETGLLRNIEDKRSVSHENFHRDGNTFQGGNWQDLHQMLNIPSGEKVLFVGDHMFADILRSKRSLGWRTCLIIPELEDELRTIEKYSDLERTGLVLRRNQQDLDEQIDFQRQKLAASVSIIENQDQLLAANSTLAELEELEQRSADLKATVREANDLHHEKFNSKWGQLFKAGFQDSRFSKQVVDYACLYTSRATNLGLVWPNRFFRPVPDVMPHDQNILPTSIA